ncbi:dethiobiotin synthase [Barnesiella viscericola]|uniref:ATP-dependent dethiobiotin synthetase BioD n=1 Tax=Barnesiella viscericola TaxID=397865 RepID=A0A921SVR4_9BACT|nr:dethiobiotin synthase [Barnesiella viscericola]HJG89903.1 dethiobiotin synthase [Barnesiella viscericola]
MKGTFFITGIDTNIGKSYATGWLAREWNRQGIKTITQKMIQTGNVGHSEDIDLHREIMGIPFTEEDREHITFPIVYSYPASPHLAAEIDHQTIPIDKIAESTRILRDRYDVVLLEGAGGLMVPITRDYLTIDYVADHELPVILVTSGRLGSINHTLLSIEALEKRGIQLYGLVYNTYPKSDEFIDADTEAYLRTYLEKQHPEAHFWVLPQIELTR